MSVNHEIYVARGVKLSRELVAQLGQEYEEGAYEWLENSTLDFPDLEVITVGSNYSGVTEHAVVYKSTLVESSDLEGWARAKPGRTGGKIKRQMKEFMQELGQPDYEVELLVGGLWS